MVAAYFSSTNGQKELRHRILDVFKDALKIAESKKVSIQIMCFSFTDDLIYSGLIELLENRNVTVKILSDWSGISTDKKRKIHVLHQNEYPNLEIRLKYDFPYSWNSEGRTLQWNYAESCGFLHHKTLLVLTEEKPCRLIAGSFNWTKRSNNGYENLIDFQASDDNRSIFHSFQNEFTAMWNDPVLAIKLEEAHELTAIMTQAYASNIELVPYSVIENECQAQLSSHVDKTPSKKKVVDDERIVAFGGSHPISQRINRGFAQSNHNRSFCLKKNNGSLKSVPLSIVNLSLDLIARVKPNTVLRVAMFALSNRVAEYGAIIEAARRGVEIRLIMDAGPGGKTAALLNALCEKERLNIAVRTCAKFMHHKYMVDREGEAVLTGTANMTTDAYSKHAEHRLLLRNNHSLAKSFAANFDMIWERLQ